MLTPHRLHHQHLCDGLRHWSDFSIRHNGWDTSLDNISLAFGEIIEHKPHHHHNSHHHHHPPVWLVPVSLWQPLVCVPGKDLLASGYAVRILVEVSLSSTSSSSSSPSSSLSSTPSSSITLLFPWKGHPNMHKYFSTIYVLQYLLL